MNGMEMMLKSMGLGGIIEQAQQMANDGTFAKIVEFANNAEKYTSLLEKIARDYDNVCAKCGGDVGGVVVIPALASAGNEPDDNRVSNGVRNEPGPLQHVEHGS